MRDDMDIGNSWFRDYSGIPEYAETVQYPIKREAGEMYVFYSDGEKWIDIRYLDHFPNKN